MTTPPVDALLPAPDPRRWFAAGIVSLSALIVVLDNTVLNVAIPTILREFDTDLPSLQWVLTGYSLTFATLLIIGGRLGDIFGARRMFLIGAGIFGTGSLVAALSTGVPMLFLGESLIEGIGASLMLPATLSILSTMFRGRERAIAFAMWGTVVGAGVAFGPLVGGFLTTTYSWRWSFGINVIIVPLIVLGAIAFMPGGERSGVRPRIDYPGAALIAAGSFSIVFAISEGSSFGWWAPIKDLTIGPFHWPTSRAVSIISPVFLLGVLLLVAFYFVERATERRHGDPLFEFGQFRHLGFRYGLLTTAVLAMGQFALLFVLPVLLQNGQQLSALRTGIWMLPTGVLIAVGAPLSAWLTRFTTVTNVVRGGLALEAGGLALVAFSISPEVSFLALLPGSAVFGLGVGLANSQLVNVILSDIDPDKAGVASGINTTVRQVGAALGIATFAALLHAQTMRHAIASVTRSALPAPLRENAIAQLHARGVNFEVSTSSAVQRTTLRRIIESAVADGARPALLFAAGVVSIGALLSLLIPQVAADTQPADTAGLDVVTAFDSLDPVLGSTSTRP